MTKRPVEVGDPTGTPPKNPRGVVNIMSLMNILLQPCPVARTNIGNDREQKPERIDENLFCQRNDSWKSVHTPTTLLVRGNIQPCIKAHKPRGGRAQPWARMALGWVAVWVLSQDLVCHRLSAASQALNHGSLIHSEHIQTGTRSSCGYISTLVHNQSNPLTKHWYHEWLAVPARTNGPMVVQGGHITADHVQIKRHNKAGPWWLEQCGPVSK